MGLCPSGMPCGPSAAASVGDWIFMDLLSFLLRPIVELNGKLGAAC